MIVVICPGIHPPELTAGFMADLESALAQPSNRGPFRNASLDQPLNLWVLPSEIAPYGPDPIHAFVTQRWQAAQWPPETPTVWLGFSAGVVGAVAAARQWQRRGGNVRGLIAVDGWGVPLGESFPRFRLGHDRFTAQSCEWLGASDGYFYCDPAVGHLDLWQSPRQSLGHWHPNLQPNLQPNLKSPPFKLDFGPLTQHQSINAAQLLAQLLILLCQAEKH